MRDALTHRRLAFALALTAAVAFALPLPAQAGPGKPTPPAPAPVSADGGGAADASVAELTPSGDEAFSPDILTASTSLTARDLAKEKGQRVEVLDQRTTTSSTYALPDGSWEVAQSGAPQWAQTSGDGKRATDWANVDVRLAENGDGSYSPYAHPQDIVVNGGNGEFFRLSDAETGLAVALALGDATVPAPSVDGSRATFAGIARDTDLVLEIQPAGYEYFLVLKSPAAAAAASDIPLVLTMSGATMMPDEAGGFTLVDDSGALVGSMPPPAAWDAESDLKRGSPILEDWSPTQKFAPVTRALDKLAPADRVSKVRRFLASGADLQTEEIVDVAQAIAPAAVPGTFDVELAVPTDWVDAASTEYPLVLDPSGAVGAAFDTWVQQGYTSDQSGSTELKLGTYDNGVHSARSFLSFEWKDLQYTTVSSARLILWEWHSWSCSPRGWHAFLASPANTSTRWTSQPWFGSPYGTSYETLGYSASCNDGWVGVDVTSLAQVWSAYQAGTYHSVALASESTASSYYWKRFNSNEAGWGQPYVAVTYTSTPPKAPTNITVGGEFLTAAHRTDFTVKRPVFSATVDDIPDPPTGGAVRNLHAVFVLYKDGVEVGTYDGTTVAPGNLSTYTPTFDLEEGANYTVYVATVFNATTVSTGIDGGGKFTTTSAPPATASGLKINSSFIPAGVLNADGSVSVVNAPLAFTGLKDIIEVGDANGDGDRDLLAWTVAGTLGLYLGDGAGGVQSATPIPVAGNWAAYAQIIAPGDWNGDGKVDLITLDAAGNLYLHLGDGAGDVLGPLGRDRDGWQGFRDIFTPGDIDSDGTTISWPDAPATGCSSTGQRYRRGWRIGPRYRDRHGWGFPPSLRPATSTTTRTTRRPLAWTKSTGAFYSTTELGRVAGLTEERHRATHGVDYTLIFAPGDFNGDGNSDLSGAERRPSRSSRERSRGNLHDREPGRRSCARHHTRTGVIGDSIRP